MPQGENDTVALSVGSDAGSSVGTDVVELRVRVTLGIVITVFADSDSDRDLLTEVKADIYGCKTVSLLLRGTETEVDPCTVVDPLRLWIVE